MDVKGQEERKKDVDSNGSRKVISSEATKFEEESEGVIFEIVAFKVFSQETPPGRSPPLEPPLEWRLEEPEN